MNKQDLETREKIIRNTFDDKRKIVQYIPTQDLELDDTARQSGEFFLVDDGEIVDLELQLEDFTTDELAEYVEIAEQIYEKHNRVTSIYILCLKDTDVKVRQFEIYSDVDFNIKLAYGRSDICSMVLKHIKEKMKHEKLTLEDLKIVAVLPTICEKEERKYYRKESFKIINDFPY